MWNAKLVYQVYEFEVWNDQLVNDIIEPRHEISNNVVYATSKASDQPAHMGSLIRPFASRLNILLILSYSTNILSSF